MIARSVPLAQSGSVVAAEAETSIRPARAALAEPRAEGAIRAGQQARGADALLAEQAPGLTIASLMLRTTTSNLIAVSRVLFDPDDPEVCGPAPAQRYRLHRKRATMSMPWLRLSATAVAHNQPRHHTRDTRAQVKANLDPRVGAHLPFAA